VLADIEPLLSHRRTQKNTAETGHRKTQDNTGNTPQQKSPDLCCLCFSVALLFVEAVDHFAHRNTSGPFDSTTANPAFRQNGMLVIELTAASLPASRLFQ
jgi:hypothetical protein